MIRFRMLIAGLGWLLWAAALSAADAVTWVEQVAAQGDTQAMMRLIQSGPAAAQVIEGRLSAWVSDQAAVDAAVARLAGAPDAAEAADAEARLLQLPCPEVRDGLLEAIAASDNSQVRLRLARAAARLGQRPDGRAMLTAALAQLYQLHPRELAPPRIDRLMRDPYDATALMFVQASPASVLAEAAAGDDATRRLRLAVAKLWTGPHPDRELATWLAAFTGRELMHEAQATYWPVTLDSTRPSTTPTYTITSLAHLRDGVTAHRVLRLRHFADQHTLGKWEQIELSERWTYLGRLVPSHVGYRGLAWMHPPLWLRPPGFSSPSKQSQAVLVNDVPEGLKLPSIKMSVSEFVQWRQGWAFNWIRPLLPSDQSDVTNLQEARYPEPAVVGKPTTDAPDPWPEAPRPKPKSLTPPLWRPGSRTCASR